MRAAAIDLLSRLDELEDPEEREHLRVQLLELLAEFPGENGNAAVAARPAAEQRVYARIECPDTVGADAPFEVTIGLTPELDPALLSTPIDLPPGRPSVTVSVSADWIDLEPGQAASHDLRVGGDGPPPTVTLRLKAEPPAADAHAARLHALYLHDGHTVGFGSRSLIVTRTPGVQTLAERTPRR